MNEPVYARYRNAFVAELARALGVLPSEIDAQVKPAEAAHGDLSFATFPLAKGQKKAPAAIASALATSIKVPGQEIVSAGPYVNARFLPVPFAAEVIDAARAQGPAYGHGQGGEGKTVVIDYSSPNIAKPIA